jgi:hypothetical protein
MLEKYLIVNKNCGKFKVLRELIPIGYCKGQRVFEIEFLETGYKTSITTSAFRTGEVKDRSIPSVYGVGYTGNMEGLEGTDLRMINSVWSGILCRCYNKDDKHYHSYGGAGVRISDDWLCFANFYKDVAMLYGYQNKIAHPNMYQLDKDYLQLNVPKSQRIYSKETCLWLSVYENALVKGRDNGYIKYFGVTFDSGYYYTIIYYKYYGRFKTPELAACMFNYIYPIVRVKEFTSLPMINPVPMIPFEELEKQNLLIKRNNLDEALSNNNIISSTTIREDGVELK